MYEHRPDRPDDLGHTSHRGSRSQWVYAGIWSSDLIASRSRAFANRGGAHHAYTGDGITRAYNLARR